MKKEIIFFFLFTQMCFCQNNSWEILSSIEKEVSNNSQAMSLLSKLTDVYGPRLTGSREYLESAKWMLNTMKRIGLDSVWFERTCDECRGWSINSFNLELIAPNYMNIVAYPLAMTKSTDGIISGEVIYLRNWWELKDIKETFTGKLKGKIVLIGNSPKSYNLSNQLIKKYTDKELNGFKNIQKPKNEAIKYTPELVEYIYQDDRDDQQFFEFLEREGVKGVITTNTSPPGVLRVEKTFYFLNSDYKPLPVFSVISEHFGRILRILENGVTPVIRMNLDTEFYTEPKNNVNIIGEIKGSDPGLHSEIVMVGGHFDSWHSATGATDNGVSVIILVEALRILKKINYKPKRTIRIALWHGEEQAFYGSLGYAEKHFGSPWNEPNEQSKKISAYLNLDNGAGLIRGIYLQENSKAKPYFDKAFYPLKFISDGITTIENQLYTDHIVFDHYNIPSFQLLQDPLAFYSMTLHTNMDTYENIPEDDVKKNSLIMAYLIYHLAESKQMVPRKNN